MVVFTVLETSFKTLESRFIQNFNSKMEAECWTKAHEKECNNSFFEIIVNDLQKKAFLLIDKVFFKTDYDFTKYYLCCCLEEINQLQQNILNSSSKDYDHKFSIEEAEIPLMYQ